VTYSFQAGPDSNPHTVETPYSPQQVEYTRAAFSLTPDQIHGSILIIQSCHESLLDQAIIKTDGSGKVFMLRAVRDSLETCQDCEGLGYSSGSLCAPCGGKGTGSKARPAQG
jgi:hypothetical protein